RAEDALETLQTLPPGPDADFCRARALAALERWSEAQPLFHELAANADFLNASAARLCEAEAFQKLGRLKEAVAAAESIKNPDTAARLILAGLYLNAGDLKKCRALAETIEPKTASETKWRKYLD